MSLRRSPILLTLALAGCVTPKAAPPPPPRAVTAPPRPAPAPAIVGSDWRDWPLTPGDWRYRPSSGGGMAVFAPGSAAPVVTITCFANRRRVLLSVAGSTPQVTVRTSSQARTLAASVVAHHDGAPAVTSDIELATTDTLLDAMGFSRGRFVIELAGQRPLVLPAWAEILRVTEDCRG